MATREIQILTEEQGAQSTGTYNGKFLSERWRPCSASTWPSLAREMYETDDAVGGGYDAFVSSVLAGKFKIAPGDPSNEDSVFYANLLARNLGLDGKQSDVLEIEFEKLIEKMLWFKAVGFLYLEHVWVHNKEEDVWFVSNIRDLPPELHDQWVTWEDSEGFYKEKVFTGRLEGVTQIYISGDSVASKETNKPFIPSKKLLLLVNKQKGNDYNGVGSFRQVELPFIIRRHAMRKLERIASSPEKVPVVQTKVDKDETDSCVIKNQSERRDRVLQQLARYGHGNQMFIESFDDVSIVDVIDGTDDPETCEKIIEAMSTLINRRFFIQHIQLGSTETGARAVGVVHDNIHKREAANAADAICSVFNGAWRAGGGLIGAFMRLNAPEDFPSELWPRMVHEGLQIDDKIDRFDMALSALQAGALGPVDVELSNWFRQAIGIPVKTVQSAESNDIPDTEEDAPEEVLESEVQLPEGQEE